MGMGIEIGSFLPLVEPPHHMNSEPLPGLPGDGGLTRQAHHWRRFEHLSLSRLAILRWRRFEHLSMAAV